MCGIAGVVIKDRKLHPVGDALTKMLDALQHRGPDSAGFAIYGGLGLEENEYLLNIEVKEKKLIIEKESLQCQIQNAAIQRLVARNVGPITRRQFPRSPNARIAASRNSCIVHVRTAAITTAVRSLFQKKHNAISP